MATGELVKLGHTLSLSDVPGTPAEWANRFYQAKKAENVSEFTLTFYRQQLTHFLNYCEGQVIGGMAELTPDIVRRFMLWHEETGHNAGGLHAAYRVLKTFLLWYENEFEPENWRNPIRKVKPPKLAIEPLEPVDLADVAALVKACGGSRLLDLRDKALLLFLVDTGARAREAARVDLADVDPASGDVLIRQGKGRKPRTLYLEKTARRALRAYLKARRDNSPALWVTDDGERLEYGGLRKTIIRRAEAAGIEAPALHSFRRAFALNMLRKKVDLERLARMMGHSDLKVLRRYLALVDDDLREAHAAGSPANQLKGL
ncbi:MAG: tyrosine-type recombinase/integrase [Chloroflexota bacterium]